MRKFELWWESNYHKRFMGSKKIENSFKEVARHAWKARNQKLDSTIVSHRTPIPKKLTMKK